MYLGIDLGTSCVKVIILDSNDQLLAQASSALTVSRPHPQWSEQDPKDWWHATCLAMAELKTTKPDLVNKLSLLVYQAKCMVQPCLTVITTLFDLPFYGMTAAVNLNAKRWKL